MKTVKYLFLFIILILLGLIFLYSNKNPTSLNSSTLSYKRDIKINNFNNDGFLLFNRRHSNIVNAMDFKGEILKSWKINDNGEGVHFSKIYNNFLYSIIQVRKLIIRDLKSGKVIEKKINAHHDIDWDSKGNLYTFNLRNDSFEYKKKEYKYTVDQLLIYDKDLNIVNTVDLSIILNSFLTDNFINKNIVSIENGIPFVSDIFHVNSLSILKSSCENIYNKGDILLNVRNLNLSLILDSKTHQLKKVIKLNNLHHPHSPLLEACKFYIFDNGTKSKAQSRILGYNLKSKKYFLDFNIGSFSETLGGIVRIDSKNLLITNGRNGEFFVFNEKANKIKWLYRNNELGKGKKPRILKAHYYLKNELM